MTKNTFLAALTISAMILGSAAYAQDPEDDCDDNQSTQTEDDDCPAAILLPGQGGGAGLFGAGAGGILTAGSLAPALGALAIVGAAAASGGGGGGGSAPQTIDLGF